MPLSFKNFPYLSTATLVIPACLLVTNGLSLWGMAALVLALVWFAIQFVRWLLPPDSSRDLEHEHSDFSPAGDGGPVEGVISLVFFLSEARKTDEATIRRCVASALGIQFQVNDPESEYFVIPFPPPEKNRSYDGEIRHFMVRIPDGLFAVLLSDRPYMENPKGFARGSIRDKRLRTAIEKHVAWISVDLMEDAPDPAQTREAYRVIGRILASMGGPDCLAVYCPELQRCNEFDPGLLETLCTEDPIRLFDEPTFEPVFEISDNNPKMAAAVKEAILRWPEFVSAFRNSSMKERDRYIAKAEFREGKKSEYMWVNVLEITPENVSGRLMNDPHELLNIHRGAAVRFSMERLNDWIYPNRDGSHIGGFTLDVLADSAEG